MNSDSTDLMQAVERTLLYSSMTPVESGSMMFPLSSLTTRSKPKTLQERYENTDSEKQEK